MMKWTITENDVSSFLQMQRSQFMQSPTIYFNDIEWVLIVYPRGWNPKHKSMKIWLTSKGELGPNVNDEIATIIKLTTNLNNDTKWTERVILRRQKNSKGFQHQFPDKIGISHINSITSKQHQPKKITFKITVSLDDSNNNLEQKNPEKSENSNPTNDLNPNDEHKKHENTDNKEDDIDIISHQILETYPIYTNSEIYPNDMISSTNIWTITGNEMHRFINTKCGECFESPVFTIKNGSEWKLVIYPNGTNPEKQGSVAIYLECSKFPPLIETVSILFDIYCHETDTYSSNTCTLGVEMDNNYRRNSIAMWHPYTVELNAIKYETGITLETQLTVLRTQYTQYHTNKGLGFITNIIPFKPFGPKLKFKWTLPCNPTIYNARNDKQFISKRCDIWCLRCKPNHYNFVSLELYLVASPYLVVDIEVNITLKCPQFQIESKERTTFKKEHEKYREWKDVNLETKELSPLKIIIFECELELLKLNDRKGREINDFNHFPDHQQLENEKKENEKKENHKKENHKKENHKKEEEEDIMSDFTNKMLQFEKKMTLMEAKQTETTKKFNEKFNESKENEEKKENKENKDDMNYSDDYNDYDDDIQRLQIWFTKQLRLPQYLDIFVEDGWDDLETIKNGLKEHHLNGLIEKQGHRVKVLQHINILRQQTIK